MQRLGFKPTKAPDRIIGMNEKNAMSTHARMNLTILSKSGNNFKISFVVLENIANHEHPNRQIAATDLRKVSNYNLADPAFDKTKTIDFLLGHSVYTHIAKSRIIKGGTIPLSDTILGWTVSGIDDTHHTVITQRHSPRYGINFLDSHCTTFDTTYSFISKIPTLIQRA